MDVGSLPYYQVIWADLGHTISMCNQRTEVTTQNMAPFFIVVLLHVMEMVQHSVIFPHILHTFTATEVSIPKKSILTLLCTAWFQRQRDVVAASLTAEVNSLKARLDDAHRKHVETERELRQQADDLRACVTKSEVVIAHLQQAMKEAKEGAAALELALEERDLAVKKHKVPAKRLHLV